MQYYRTVACNGIVDRKKLENFRVSSGVLCMAGDWVQQLRTLVAFVEKLGSISSTHMTPLVPGIGLGDHMIYTHLHVGKMLIHIK